MFFTITKDNINELPICFLSREVVEEELKNNPFGRYLLYQEQEVVGYIYYSDIYERVEINQFEVKKNFRNCGIGNKLLEQFTKTVEKQITLEVKITNDNAIHLYKKYGFVEKTIRPGYYQGIDGMLMERNP